MKVLKLKIANQLWKFKVISSKTYDLKFEDDGSAATIDLTDRVVIFNKNHMSIREIRHELWHLFFSLTHVNSAELNPLQTEEVSAELFAARGAEILILANKIFHQLKG